MGIAVELLACPRCGNPSLKRNNDNLHCKSCGAEYPVRNGIPILLADPGARTQLEDIDYDALHLVSPENSIKHYKTWAQVIDHYPVNHDNILEIGSGTGMLTYGMVSEGSFDNYHVSDISEKFINVQLSRAPETEKTVRYYVCDANALPFKDNTFDVIVGNSVLHHFIDYDITLEKCFSLLKPGGIGIFAEPIREGHANIAFFNALIRDIHQRFGLDIFDEKEMDALTRMSSHVTKHLRIGNDRERLAKLEDKYIFSITEMQALGEKIGYSDVRFFNFGIETPWKPTRSYRREHQWVMRQHGVSAEKLDQFAYLYDAFARTFSDSVNDSLYTPFGFFVFRK